MKNFWNERYKEPSFVYGIEPNKFLAEELVKLNEGAILFPCEGEGRNAVYASKRKWNVSAFDMSTIGKTKALQFAKDENVSINYKIADALTINYKQAQFDAIALIYAHFDEKFRTKVHKKITTWLKPGGTLILEAFNFNQLGAHSGGPKELSQLYNENLLSNDFSELKTVQLYSSEVILKEGKYHNGKAHIIRYVGRKEM